MTDRIIIYAYLYATKEVKLLSGFRYLSDKLTEIWYPTEFIVTQNGEETVNTGYVNRVLHNCELKLYQEKESNNE